MRLSTLMHGNLADQNPFTADPSQVAAWKAEEERRIWAERLKKSNIPELYHQAKLSTCKQEIRDWYETLQNGFSGWLLLSGSNGTGKTYSACAIGIQAARNDNVCFSTMHEIVSKVQSTFNGSGNPERVLRQYKHTPLLIVDEMEKFKATEWSAPLVFDLLNFRYNQNKPTIFTTNLTGEKMFSALAKGASEELAASIMSRLADHRNTHVTLDGEDRRLK